MYDVRKLSDETIIEICYLSEFKERLSDVDVEAHDELMARGLQGKQYCAFIEWYSEEFGI